MNKPGEGLREKILSICEEVRCAGYFDGYIYAGGENPPQLDGLLPKEAVEAILSLVVGCVPTKSDTALEGGTHEEYDVGFNKCRKVLLDNMGVGE